MKPDILRAALAAVLVMLFAAPAWSQDDEAERKVGDALSAAIPGIAAAATVVDWEGTVLREGSNGWTCMPTPPQLDGVAPMCFDGPWMSWAQAWMNKTRPEIDRVGIAYMLRGDGGVSNSDPYGTDPAVDDWVQAGPHLMILAPDPAVFDGTPTDPDNGGPWVMWKGTPYAHVMVPVPGHDGASGHATAPVPGHESDSGHD